MTTLWTWIVSLFSGASLKILGIVAVIILIGGMYIYQQHLKSVIAEDQVELIKYKADTDKLIQEIDLMKTDKDNMEKSISALQDTLDKQAQTCKQNLAEAEKKYNILINRKFTSNKTLIQKGATIDEGTSDSFVKQFNSRYFTK